MKGILGVLCPCCCVRGEPEEKRLELTDHVKTPKYAEEKVSLLETDEKLQNTANDDETKGVKRGVEIISEPNHNYNEENKDNSNEGEPQRKQLEVTDEVKTPKLAEEEVVLLETDEKLLQNTASDDESTGVKRSVEVISEPNHKYNEENKDNSSEGIEYADKNGTQSRRLVNKSVTITLVRTTSREDPASVTDLPATLEGTNEEEGKQVAIQFESKSHPIREKEVPLQVESKPQTATDRQDIIMEMKGQPIYRREMQVSEKRSTGNASFGAGSRGNSYTSVHQRSIVTKTIGGREGLKSSGQGSEAPIIVIKKQRYQADLPEWLEEGRPAQENRPAKLHSEISAHLKYPTNYAPKKITLNDRAREVRINAEVSKREKPDISMLSVEQMLKKEDEKRSTATASIGGGSRGNNYTSVHQRSVATKTSGGRDGTKSSGQGSEAPIMVIKKQRYQADLPEWLEEGRPEQENRPAKLHSEISAHLKYPTNYAPKKIRLNDRAREVRINAEVSKREKPDISMLSVEQMLKKEEEMKKAHQKEVAAPPADKATEPEEEEEEEEEEEDDDDEEFDEFEEEIVVLEVRRAPRFHRQLEIPKREPPKVGVPIEDLLVLPRVQKQQESTPKDFLVDEKIEAVERVSIEFAMPDIGVLENK